MNHEAQTVKLSQATCRNVFGVKGARAEDANGTEAHGINKHLLVFTGEITLNLVEDGLAVGLGCCEFAKLKGLARTPEEATLREICMAKAVHANCKVVV